MAISVDVVLRRAAVWRAAEAPRSLWAGNEASPGREERPDTSRQGTACLLCPVVTPYGHHLVADTRPVRDPQAIRRRRVNRRRSFTRIE
jgi:hypothetical protein